MSQSTPWSEAILAGLILQTLGVMLTNLVVFGLVAQVAGIGFFAAGVVVSRRSTWLLRDFLAYALLTFISLSATYNLVELTLGRSPLSGPSVAPLALSINVVALASGLGLLTALRRIERVPYFG